MSLQVFNELEQGTDEWLAARCGIVTASVVGQLITPKTIKPAVNDTSRGLTNTLAAERITDYVEPVQPSRAMERGNLDEPFARDAYAEHKGLAVDQIGFMVRQFDGFKIGFSPDGLVGDNGLIEIKSRAQKTQLKTVLADEVPAENLAQIQCGLLVSGRDWCDYVSYSGGMKLWTKRVYPDTAWHEAILAAVKQFEANAAEAVSAYLAATADMPDTERIDHFPEMEIF
jgi:predicted phage-related endonuclease